MTVKILGYGALSYVTLSLVSFTLKEDWASAYHAITWWHLSLQVPLFFGALVLTKHMTESHPLMQWNLLRVLKKLRRSRGVNILFLPTLIPYFGIFFCLLLFPLMPTVAETEEKLFRDGTSNWIEGFFRCVLFGFSHLLVGVPIGAACTLTLLGLFLTQMYFLGGLELSTEAHFYHNLIMLICIFTFLLKSHSQLFLAKMKRMRRQKALSHA